MCPHVKVCDICPHVSVDMSLRVLGAVLIAGLLLTIFFLKSKESSGEGSAVFCLLHHRTAMWSASRELGCFKTGSDHSLFFFVLPWSIPKTESFHLKKKKSS